MLFRKSFFLVLVSILLSGCFGYEVTALYKKKETTAKLEKVYVVSISGKYGVYLHNSLEKLLRLTGTPKYKLTATFRIKEKGLAIARDDASVRREASVVVSYHLANFNSPTAKEVNFKTIGIANFAAGNTPLLESVSRDAAIKRALTIASEAGILRLGLEISNGNI